MSPRVGTFARRNRISFSGNDKTDRFSVSLTSFIKKKRRRAVKILAAPVKVRQKVLLPPQIMMKTLSLRVSQRSVLAPSVLLSSFATCASAVKSFRTVSFYSRPSWCFLCDWMFPVVTTFKISNLDPGRQTHLQTHTVNVSLAATFTWSKQWDNWVKAHCFANFLDFIFIFLSQQVKSQVLAHKPHKMAKCWCTRYNLIRHDAIQCNTILYNTIHKTKLYDVIQYKTYCKKGVMIYRKQ